MPPWVIDVAMVVLIVGMTYALMSEGLWGAALMFFNVLFAGLIAFNFYEPLAALLAQNVEALSGFADTLCLMALFIVSVLVLRLTTESLAPTMIRFPTPVYHLGRLVFGFLASAVTMAILLLAFETAPVHKKIFGVIDYAYAPPFKWGLDHKWLAFFQFTTGKVFADYSAEQRDPAGEYYNAKVFDPRGEWLIVHQNARPYGTDIVPEPSTGAAGVGGAGGGSPAGGPPS
ncbi:MAG: CvpA family protein, partial [Isosphaeraceae bacterium]|nr:CvpA family protein [Isosphaeraceae bacterium]